jgi:hypothetical protein
MSRLSPQARLSHHPLKQKGNPSLSIQLSLPPLHFPFTLDTKKAGWRGKKSTSASIIIIIIGHLSAVVCACDRFEII